MDLSGLKNFFNKPDTGKLIIRIGLGLIIFVHGLNKFLAGEGALEKVGSAIEIYGIDFAPVFWGVLAALVETVGGLCVVAGWFFRTATFLFMIVAFTAFLSKEPSLSLSEFNNFAYPLAMFFAFLGLTFVGPGAFAVHKD